MRTYRLLHRLGWLAFAGVFVVAGPLAAQSPEPGQNRSGAIVGDESGGSMAAGGSGDKRAALMALARDFVNKVDSGFARADDYWVSLRGEKPDKLSYLDQYQDGEILLLQIRLPGNVELDSTVVAEKQGRSLLVSLSDLVTAARFPITVDPAAGKAEGWFIRENQNFSLDYDARMVKAGAREYEIDPDTMRVTDQDIWVSGDVLSTWLGFDMQVNSNTQTMDVEPENKWPIQRKLARAKKKGGVSRRRGPPQEPRLEEPYGVAAVPNVDVFLNHRLDRRQTGSGTKTNTSSRYTLKTAGDLAGHTGESIISGDDEDKISSVRFKLGRESDKSDLLGPLKARSYEVGDITTTDIPLVRSASSEFGARVTNRNPNYTQNATTTVTGYAVPGWDVELYRDQQFVAIETVGENGQYRFNDVLLFAGSNRFRVVKYGLQGEIEEEEFTKFVGPSQQNKGKGTYDVSLTLNDRQTYLKNRRSDEDRNTPHLSAQYEQQITDDVALRSGVKAREEDGAQKIYAQAGTVMNMGGTIVNADAVVDNDGAYATEVRGRRTFASHSVGGSVRYTGEDFNVDSAEKRDAELKIDSSMRGDLPVPASWKLNSTRYNLSAEYRNGSDDFTSYDLEGGLSARYEHLNYNASLNYRIEDDAGETNENVRARTGLRGNYLGTNWRVTTAADVYPDYEPQEYELNLQRGLSEDILGQFKLEHRPVADLSEGELSLTWAGDHITVTPSVTYDTEQNLSAFINARFGVAYNPVNHNVEMYGQQLTNRGGLAARVYLDRDGDSLYGEGDELLEDVRVQSVQSSRFALSDETGIAFIPDLPTNRITDIVMNEGSLPDPFWIAGSEGVSIRPRAGNVTALDFPVHIAGEIDGTLYKIKRNGEKTTVKNTRLFLYTEEGVLQDTAYAAFDGFYLFSRVPPGNYILIVSAEDAARQKFDPPAPQDITIGYDGTIIYGNDIVGRSGEHGIGFDMVSATSFGRDLQKLDPAMLEGQKIILNLGDYNSQLLMALTWYHIRNRYGGILGDAKLIVPPSETMASLEGGKHTMRVKTDILNYEDARFICRSLIARGFACGVELLPDDFFAQLSAGTTALPDKS